MLDYKRVNEFFKNYPNGCICIVQVDEVFKLTCDVSFYLDENSITFLNIHFTRKEFGNEYKRFGDFMIPFHSIVRVEYLVKDEHQS